MEDLDKMLENAEKFMKQGEEYNKDMKNYLDSPGLRAHRAIYSGIKALYEQNKAIIELLKSQYKKINKCL